MLGAGEELVEVGRHQFALPSGHSPQDGLHDAVPLQLAQREDRHPLGLQLHDALVEQLQRVELLNQSVVRQQRLLQQFGHLQLLHQLPLPAQVGQQHSQNGQQLGPLLALQLLAVRLQQIEQEMARKGQLVLGLLPAELRQQREDEEHAVVKCRVALLFEQTTELHIVAHHLRTELLVARQLAGVPAPENYQHSLQRGLEFHARYPLHLREYGGDNVVDLLGVSGGLELRVERFEGGFGGFEGGLGVRQGG